MAPVPFTSLFDPSTPLTLIDVISECIRYNPKNRITSKACLSHAYFTETVPRIQTAPYIPPMPEAPSPSSVLSHLTQPHLASTGSTTALVSPPDSVQGATASQQPSHASGSTSYPQQPSPPNPPPSFNIGDPSRTLPLPQPSVPHSNGNRIPFYPHYRDTHSQSPGIPNSPSSASSLSLHSIHSHKTAYDAPGLEHNLTSGSTLVYGVSSSRNRTSGASALVDQLRELDLPAADLSSYGRRAAPAVVTNGNRYDANDSSLSIPMWQQQAQAHQQQQQQHHLPSSAASSSTHGTRPSHEQEVPSLEHYGQPHFSSLPANFDRSSTSVASRSTHGSSSYVPTPSDGGPGQGQNATEYRPSPPIVRTPYDDDLSMPPPPPPIKIDEPVRRQDVVMANAQVEAAKRQALAAIPTKKKRWGLGSVFGSGSHSNDSKHSHHHHEQLASVGEEAAASTASVPLKRTQSVSNDPHLDTPAPPLDAKAAQKEAKRQAKQLELAKREAASAAAKERARAVMLKRERLVNEQVNGKSSSIHSGSSSIDLKAGAKDKDKGSKTSLEQHQQHPSSTSQSQPHPSTNGQASSSQGSLGSSYRSVSHSNNSSRQLLQPTHNSSTTTTDTTSSSIHTSSTPTLGSTTSSFRNDPLALAQHHRHKSRRRDGDDDHSMSSYGGGGGHHSLRSSSNMSFASIDSDPGPKPSSRLYPSSLGLNRATSSQMSGGSSLGPGGSSPQLYSLPHGSGSIENQLARDFREHTKLASSGGYSAGNGGGGIGGLGSASSSSFELHRSYGATGRSSGLGSHGGVQNGGASPSGGYVNPMFQVVRSLIDDPVSFLSFGSHAFSLPLPFSLFAIMSGRSLSRLFCVAFLVHTENRWILQFEPLRPTPIKRRLFHPFPISLPLRINIITTIILHTIIPIITPNSNNSSSSNIAILRRRHRHRQGCPRTVEKCTDD